MSLFFILVVFLLLLSTSQAFAQLSEKTGLKQDFLIETGGYEFTVDLTSNFDIEKIDFSSDEKRLTFYIISNLQNNLAEIQIPINLINGNFTFFLNDQEIFPTVKTSEKISFITVEFEDNGRHKLDIIGTTYLPEFYEMASLVLFSSLFVVFLILKFKNKMLTIHSFNKD